MKKNILIITVLAVLFSCGNETENSGTPAEKPKSMLTEQPATSDDGKGIGEIKEVALNNPLNPEMVKKGSAIFDMKCAACHKLTDQRVVGPGWKGLTERRKPEWIMNMITNVDVMLEKDPAAQALLKECLVRMPNQNLSVGDARDVLEFAFSNDGQVVGK